MFSLSYMHSSFIMAVWLVIYFIFSIKVCSPCMQYIPFWTSPVCLRESLQTCRPLTHWFQPLIQPPKWGSKIDLCFYLPKHRLLWWWQWRETERERLMGSEIERNSVWIWGLFNRCCFIVPLKTFFFFLFTFSLCLFHFLVTLLTLCYALSCPDSKWQCSLKRLLEAKAWVSVTRGWCAI